MKNWFVVTLFVLLFASMSFASMVSTDGLNDTQKAKVDQFIAQQKIESTQNPLGTVEPSTVEKYANIGAMIGKAIASTAKELNIAVNDFAVTPVGKLTFALIVWKFIGIEVARIAIGVPLLTVFIIFWIYFFRKMCVLAAVEYDKATGKRTKLIYRENDDTGTNVTRFLMTVVLIAGIVGLCCMMFC